MSTIYRQRYVKVASSLEKFVRSQIFRFKSRSSTEAEIAKHDKIQFRIVNDKLVVQSCSVIEVNAIDFCTAGRCHVGRRRNIKTQRLVPLLSVEYHGFMFPLKSSYERIDAFIVIKQLRGELTNKVLLVYL